MERKLASIQRILAIEPIEGADTIAKATVLGWSLVIKKEEFKPGDLCVYMEVDSVLPEKPEFEFLRPRGFRIRTVRLRKQVSQGIAFPLSILPAEHAAIIEGEDVTAVLGVTKHEAAPPENSVELKGGFPGFLKTTDETRVQAVPEIVERYHGQMFYITEKLDGTSMSVFFRDGEFGVCSRNFELLDRPASLMWRLARELQLEEKLRALGNMAVQGELIGPGIQKNKYKLDVPEFHLFNVFDIDRYAYLDFESFVKAAADMGLKTVPLLEKEHVLTESVPELVTLSMGASRLNPASQREGIVLRPLNEQRDPDLGRLSFKVINPEFLLKYDE